MQTERGDGMSRRTIVTLITVWLVSIVGTALWAQSSDLRRVPTLTEGQSRGSIITGAENIGFQPVAAEHAPGKIAGKWMVKVNGVWVETQSPIGIVR
jgi:hypothetical protein